MMDWLYLATGLTLPLFYIPQILKLLRDHTKLAAYSMTKAIAQLLLRAVGLLYVFTVNLDPNIMIVIGADVLGRSIELAVAINAMHKQRKTAALASEVDESDRLATGWSSLDKLNR